jgi:hypothetical protein
MYQVYTIFQDIAIFVKNMHLNLINIFYKKLYYI